jgi:hypothetical protein
MFKKTGFKLLGLVALVSFLFIAQAQTEEPGWKKTIKLPSGEVVCDLNGEWNPLFMGGVGNSMGRQERDVIKITQKGKSFKGVRTIGSQFLLKGSVAIEGELDNNGFKELIYRGDTNISHPEGKISKDGNKIEIRYGNIFDVELTRR